MLKQPCTLSRLTWCQGGRARTARAGGVSSRSRWVPPEQNCSSRCGRQQPWTPAHLNTLSWSVPTTCRQQDSRGLPFPTRRAAFAPSSRWKTPGTVTRIQLVLNSRLPKVARENLHKGTAFNASAPTATHAGTSAIQGWFCHDALATAAQCSPLSRALRGPNAAVGDIGAPHSVAGGRILASWESTTSRWLRWLVGGGHCSDPWFGVRTTDD